jgi:hypothetical protein
MPDGQAEALAKDALQVAQRALAQLQEERDSPDSNFMLDITPTHAAASLVSCLALLLFTRAVAGPRSTRHLEPAADYWELIRRCLDPLLLTPPSMVAMASNSTLPPLRFFPVMLA